MEDRHLEDLCASQQRAPRPHHSYYDCPVQRADHGQHPHRSREAFPARNHSIHDPIFGAIELSQWDPTTSYPSIERCSHFFLRAASSDAFEVVFQKDSLTKK